MHTAQGDGLPLALGLSLHLVITAASPAWMTSSTIMVTHYA